jgi:ribosomal peptide maturation radical SAM protein 1
MGHQPKKALLAYMPLGLLQIPSLGLSLLRSGLERRGIDCSVRYFNLDFVDRFCPGEGDAAAREYIALTSRYPTNFLAEACFAHELFGPHPRRDRRFEELRRPGSERESAWLEAVADAVPPFIEWCLGAVDWSEHRIVGFSTTFIGQTLPSLLLADRLKAAHPHLVVVLGGANTEGEMGVELLRQFPQVDLVLRGECDETFPELCGRVLAGEPLDGIPGLVRRSPLDGAVEAQPPALVRDMDALAPPNFDDWVEQALATSFAARYRRKLELPFESSRGCWWGEVSHCLFCGINGDAMTFRGKTPARTRSEIELLVERYRPTLLVGADAILDHRYYATLLEDLAARPVDVALSYEIKANVTRRHVRALAAAKVVDVVPGIEALSTRLLGLIGKGSTAITNLLCLRLAAEHGVHVTWYHLCGLPFEEIDDYRREAELIERIHHLQPPREVARFTLQRFSPYFRDPAKHGIAEVRALEYYDAVFPFDQDVVDRLAYNFSFRFGDGRSAETTAEIEALLEDALGAWRANHGRVRLDAIPLGDRLMIVDTRRRPAAVILLDAIAAALYLRLDPGVTVDALVRACGGLEVAADRDGAALAAARRAARREAEAIGGRLVELAGPVATADAAEARRTREIERFLDDLDALGLVFTEAGKSVALALFAAARTEPAATTRPRARLQVVAG